MPVIISQNDDVMRALRRPVQRHHPYRLFDMATFLVQIIKPQGQTSRYFSIIGRQ